MNRTVLVPICTTLALAACSDPNFANVNCKDAENTCTEVSSEEPSALLEAVNSLDDDATVVLGAGTFSLDATVTIRNSGITFLGQTGGEDGELETTLDFAGGEAGSNGVDVVGDGFTIEGLTILDAKKDGLRIEDSDRIVIRGVVAAWTNEDDPTNGAYGLYPVKVSNVLIEDSEAHNASDAGIYVGQCQYAIVRNNTATGNVAGIEIENTEYADVHDNIATDNTAGLLVFDLPGNPIIGRDISIHGNSVTDNNRPNFAASGTTVASIPAGTGTFAMASRRVEIFGNTYADNGTVDVAIISGLALEDDPAQWALDPTTLVGDFDDLGLISDSDTGAVFNFRTQEIYVHDNAHSGSGTLVDAGAVDNDCFIDPSSDACTRPIGLLVKVTYGTTPVDEIIYDTIMESEFSATVAADNSNDNHICVGPSTEATLGSLNLPVLSQTLPPTLDMVFRPASPFTPFDCSGFTAGAIAEVTVEAP